MRSVAVLIASSACCGSAAAGIVVGSGQLPLWGQQRSFTSWNVMFDPLPGVLNESSGRPIGLEFHNGRLYMGNGALAIDHGVTFYDPGASGGLSTPTTQRISGLNGDSRRFWLNRGVTINTSAEGFGVSAGSPPSLVAYGKMETGGDPGSAAVLTPSGSDLTMSPLASLPSPIFSPRAIEFIPSLDQFLFLHGEVQPDITTFTFLQDNAAGLAATPPVLSFNVAGGIRGVQVVSPAFASTLAGMPISQESLLCVEANYLGIQQAPRLLLLSLSGQQLASTDLLLPGYAQFVGGNDFGPDPRSLAVDEANGLIFIGDRGTQQIHVLTVPNPGSGAALALFAGFALRRRRQG